MFGELISTGQGAKLPSEVEPVSKLLESVTFLKEFRNRVVHQKHPVVVQR